MREQLEFSPPHLCSQSSTFVFPETSTGHMSVTCRLITIERIYHPWVAVSNNPKGYLFIPNSQFDQLRIRKLKSTWADLRH